MGLAKGVTRSTGRASLSRVIGSDGGASGGEEPPADPSLLQETGDDLLLETGDLILLDEA